MCVYVFLMYCTMYSVLGEMVVKHSSSCQELTTIIIKQNAPTAAKQTIPY